LSDQSPAPQLFPEVPPPSSPVDAGARARTLEIDKSFLVQAPAGSGKTELLIRRMLKLLANVDKPEEVLAITFTIAATAEMRGRVLKALQAAHGKEPRDDDNEEIRLAHAVLENDRRLGWHLLEQPQQLNILTIDAVCLTVAHQTPLLSRLGGSLSPTDKPQPLYTLAARRTLARLGNEPALSEALTALLELRSTKLANCEELIAGMLDKRDQWGRLLSLGPEPVNWELVRDRLQAPLLRLHEQAMEKACLLFEHHGLECELMFVLDYACGNPEVDDDLIKLKGFTRLRDLSRHEHWECLCNFLVTGGGTWRVHPPGLSGKENKAAKERYKRLLKAFDDVPEVNEVLLELRDLPPAAYTEEEFQMLRHLLLILRYAVAELRLVFAERGEVDFVELGLAAEHVLSDEEGKSTETAAAISGRWRHLLVDEFQDTSRSQYKLLTLLAAGWEASQRGTCFLVGDPMQSIYMFRQAEVELFERTSRHGLGDGTDPAQSHTVQLIPLQLQTNFRTHAGLVDRLNDMFTQVFALDPDEKDLDYHVKFARSTAYDQNPRSRPELQIWPFFLPSKATPEQKRIVAEAEAERVVSIIGEHWPTVERKLTEGGEFRIAVLVRARSHLGLIAEYLRKKEIPFRAVEIEQLGDRQEVQDLTALTRALLHPMDRIAWLAVLRAPWCGLSLKDLHTLCGGDEKAFAAQPILTLLRDRTSLLSEDGQQRAMRVRAVLEDALRGKHRQASLARWVERTWATLGGDACVDRTEFENVRTFFAMLEELGPEAGGLAERLKDLCAQPDPRANERCGVQLMTIHKAKGLGFDVVIVPGLERTTGSDPHTLLRSIEQTRLVGPAENIEQQFVVAPIGRNGKGGRIYNWIGKQQTQRQEDETKRLLYVAATRAREELHLLGTATVTDTGELRHGGKSRLLGIAWEALEDEFAAAYQKVQPLILITPQQIELFPETTKTIRLRRLPLAWKPLSAAGAAEPREELTEVIERPRGELAARAFGTVVHALLEDLAQFAGIDATGASQGVFEQVAAWRSRALVMLRSNGLPRAEAEAQSAEVVRALAGVLRDPVGRWILGARAEARTEVSWSTWDAGDVVRTLRGDRMFRAGAEPGSTDETHLWIVDYKTARHGAAGLDDFLAEEKRKYSRQLESYADITRKIRGQSTPIRLALYYPLLSKLVWW
jgi:ATP-dependent helicase/nuclease subunit A